MKRIIIIIISTLLINVVHGQKILLEAGNRWQNVPQLRVDKMLSDSLVRIGATAGNDTMTGRGNVFISDSAGTFNSGDANVAIGYKAMKLNTGGRETVAIGYRAAELYTTSGIPIEDGLSVYIGSFAGNKTTGIKNIAIGQKAYLNNTTGNNNIVIGIHGAASFTSGINNVMIGNNISDNSNASGITGDRNVFVGRNIAQGNGNKSNNTVVGDAAGVAMTSATSVTVVGQAAGNAITSATTTTIVGAQAGQAITTQTGNTLIGNTAGMGVAGNDNTAVGNGALAAASTGIQNTAIGNAALQTNTGSSNTALGMNALLANTSGSNNVAIGYRALSANLTGGENVAIGTMSGNTGALRNATTASASTAVGAGAARGASSYTVTGITALGYKAGMLGATGADYGTLVGYKAGYNISTGNRNIIIGSWVTDANSNITSGSNNLVIGNEIQAPSATGSNQINIMNLIYGTGASGTVTTSAGNIGIGIPAPIAKLEVGGDLKINTVNGSTSKDSLLTQDGGIVTKAGVYEIIDTSVIATKGYRQKGIDSLAAIPVHSEPTSRILLSNGSGGVTSDEGATIVSGLLSLGQSAYAGGALKLVGDQTGSVSIKVRSSSSQDVYDLNLPLVAGAAGETMVMNSSGNLEWRNRDGGTYAPTLIGVDNISSVSIGHISWYRADDRVFITGTISVTPTISATVTNIRMTLPVASAFNDQFDCGGTFSYAGGMTVGGVVTTDQTNDAAMFNFTPVGNSASILGFSLSYIIK